MASSSKVVFNLSTLQQKALESINLRINQKEFEARSFEDEDALEARISEWRARQEAKISELFSQLGKGGVDNHRLSKFKLDPIPEVDLYERRRAERELRALEAERSRIVAKSESLVADENGNISLTKTQLNEFFGL